MVTQKDVELAMKYMGELPSISQAIGRLNMCMGRCKSKDSKIYKRYEERLDKLEIERCDKSSYVNMILYRFKEQLIRDNT